MRPNAASLAYSFCSFVLPPHRPGPIECSLEYFYDNNKNRFIWIFGMSESTSEISTHHTQSTRRLALHAYACVCAVLCVRVCECSCAILCLLILLILGSARCVVSTLRFYTQSAPLTDCICAMFCHILALSLSRTPISSIHFSVSALILAPLGACVFFLTTFFFRSQEFRPEPEYAIFNARRIQPFSAHAFTGIFVLFTYAH